VSTFSRRDAPELCAIRALKERAQETPGARCTRSLVCKGRKHTSYSPQVHRNTRRFLRNGFNGLFRALLGDRAFLPPSLARIARANLTPASGRQDHTTSPSASAPFVRALTRLTLQRPPHPVPNVRDDRDTPLSWERDGESCRTDLDQRRSEIFLRMGMDRQIGDLPVRHFFGVAAAYGAAGDAFAPLPCRDELAPMSLPAKRSNQEIGQDGIHRRSRSLQ
jgi:hypothetical protein